MTFQQTNASGELLPPSIALNCFNPLQGTDFGESTVTPQQRKRFGFRIGQLRLLIHPDVRSEVTMQIPIHSIPNVPKWFLGVINLRGNLLPIFDLHQLLETGQNGWNKQTILILDQGRHAVGVPIDGLPQSVTLNNAMHNTPPLPDLLQAHVVTAYMTDGLPSLDFDHHSFFTMLRQHIAG